MTTLYLVRHGHYLNQESLGPSRPISSAHQQPLDDLGRNQIERLSYRLRGSPIKVILTSELARAKESGEILSKHLRAPVKETAVLNELGFFVSPKEIVTFERNEEKYQQAILDMEQASEKAIEFLEHVAAEHQGENIAVVCHGNIIRAIIGQALRADVKAMIRLQVDEASLSILEFDGDDLFRLIRFNDVAHLEG